MHIVESLEKIKNFFNVEFHLFYMIFQGDYYYNFSSLIPTILGLAIRIGFAVWIAKDAQNRQMEPAIYVILTCLCGCCIGPIVYLIAASNHPVQTGDFQQPSFNSNQGPVYGQQPQPIYGQPQHQQPQQQPRPSAQDAHTTMPSFDVIFCPICGSQNQKGAKFCSTCGADLQ